MSTLFFVVCLVHIIIWGFVLFAFVNTSTAKINLYYIVPFIYILHIFPFHLLVETKKKMNPENWEEEEQNAYNAMILPGKIIGLQKILSEFCFCSPLSPQGMLIFGAISCAWKLKLS